MSTQNLAKMGHARVSIESLNGVDCVLKQGASAVEIHFYQTAASHLTGVNAPALLQIDGSNLYIEHIPNSLSLQELRTRSELYAQLASLHLCKYIPAFAVKKHDWTRLATDNALKILKLSDCEASTVQYIQSLSGCIFECNTLISGDTNDGNWGTRNSGELVLFDWERFGYGSPAIDLAPLVNGMGTVADYKLIINQYTQHNPLWSQEKLLKHLIIAKCWIMVEVVNILVNRNNPQQETYINWYRVNIPLWLSAVKSML